MPVSKEEVNFVRLLNRCKKLAQKDGVIFCKLEKYVECLEELLNVLQSERRQ